MKLGSFISILFFSITSLNAQVIFDLPHEDKPELKRFGASFQVGLIFINPVEVNAYIQKYIKNQIGNGVVFLKHGDENISSAINLNFSPTIKFTNYTLRCMADFGIASKSITVNSKENRFSILRFSPGLLLDRFFDIDNKKQFFAGAGVQYQFMSFENTPANGFGGRIESGFRFRTLEETNYSFFYCLIWLIKRHPQPLLPKSKVLISQGLALEQE